jgi:hypothetical protein
MFYLKAVLNMLNDAWEDGCELYYANLISPSSVYETSDSIYTATK